MNKLFGWMLNHTILAEKLEIKFLSSWMLRMLNNSMDFTKSDTKKMYFLLFIIIINIYLNLSK